MLFNIRILKKSYFEDTKVKLIARKLLRWTKTLITKKYQLISWVCDSVLQDGIILFRYNIHSYSAILTNNYIIFVNSDESQAINSVQPLG